MQGSPARPKYVHKFRTVTGRPDSFPYEAAPYIVRALRTSRGGGAPNSRRLLAVEAERAFIADQRARAGRAGACSSNCRASSCTSPTVALFARGKLGTPILFHPHGGGLRCVMNNNGQHVTTGGSGDHSPHVRAAGHGE